MARDSLHVDTKERKPVIHETFVTDSTNVMRLFQFARDPNIHFETYVNGVCVAGLALSVVEFENDFSTLSLIHEFKAMEDSLRRFSSNTESRRLLRDDQDEEEYELKEGAYEEFVSWVDSNSVKYPASADLPTSKPRPFSSTGPSTSARKSPKILTTRSTSTELLKR